MTLRRPPERAAERACVDVRAPGHHERPDVLECLIGDAGVRRKTLSAGQLPADEEIGSIRGIVHAVYREDIVTLSQGIELTAETEASSPRHADINST